MSGQIENWIWRLAAKYEAYLFAQMPPNRVCIFRIFLGGLLGYAIFDIYINDLFWANQNTGFPFNIFALNNLVPDPTSADAVIWRIKFFGFFSLASAFFLTIGLCSRISAFVCFLSFSVLREFNPFLLKGADDLMRLFALMMAFAPCGARFSIDRILVTSAGSVRRQSQVFSVCSLRFMQMQIAALYLVAGLCKVGHEEWVHGTAVYYSTRSWVLQHFHLPYILDHAWTIKALSWGTVVSEISLGLLLPFNRFRWPLIAFGIAFHIGLELCLFLPIWEWCMIASFILLLPDTFEFKLNKFFERKNLSQR